MTWIPLLLADASISLRILVLKDLMGRPEDDSEVQELRRLQEQDPLISGLLTSQVSDGSWTEIDKAGSTRGGSLRATSFALMRLGFLEMDREHPAIKRGVSYVLDHMRQDGSWPIPKTYDGMAAETSGYTMIPLQTAIPLLGVAMAGHATDERAERAYDWLLGQRLEDGAWPVGRVGKVLGYQAGYRQVPHSRWGCRTNTTLALSCLAFHPKRRKSDAARKALDLLIARETRDRHNLGFNVTRLVGFEPHRGNISYHARFDPGMILDLCWRIGADRSDERVDDLVRWLLKQQGEYGLWLCDQHPEASRWISFDLLRSLSNIDCSKEWFSEEPRTAYKSYPKRPRRF